jgi:hypothetical protein
MDVAATIFPLGLRTDRRIPASITLNAVMRAADCRDTTAALMYQKIDISEAGRSQPPRLSE